MLPTIVLASASPARLQLLRNAGIEPAVRVSHLDEEAIAFKAGWSSAADVAGGLAIAKAREIASHIDHAHPDHIDTIVIGCDSVMEFDGGLHGKPGNEAAARERLRAMSGGRGHLHTGHHVIRLNNGETTAASAVTATEVVFHELTDAEIDAYVATGEPLHVAGAYTLDSLGGPFIAEIHGDPSNVIGLSLPTLRRLFAELGLGWETVLAAVTSA